MARASARVLRKKKTSTDDVTKSDLKTHILRAFQTVNFSTIGTWIDFFFLSLLGKSHQILHVHYCITRQKRKLRIPPKFMYRFSCSFVSWNCLDVYSVSPKTK